MVRVALLLSLFATALCADGKIAPSPVPGSGRVKHSGPDFSFEIPGVYTPLPATAQKWTYRAIYIVGDAQVGVWSKSVVVTVGG